MKKEPRTKLNGYELLDAAPILDKDGKAAVKETGIHPDGRPDYDFQVRALASLPPEVCPGGAGDYMAMMTYTMSGDKDKRAPVEDIAFYQGRSDGRGGFLLSPAGPGRFTDAQREAITEGLDALAKERGGTMSPLTQEEFAAIRQVTLMNQPPERARIIEDVWNAKPLAEQYGLYVKSLPEREQEGLLCNPGRLEGPGIQMDGMRAPAMSPSIVKAMELADMFPGSRAVESTYEFS